MQAQTKDESARLDQLRAKEEEIQERVAATLEALRSKRTFELDISGTDRLRRGAANFPHSVLARRCDDHVHRYDEGPIKLERDATYIHLLVDFLRSGELPVVDSVSQIQWLEREATYYKLESLVALCRDAYKRLDTVKVMQLLNGQKNLSGMDMRKLDLSSIDFTEASLYRAQLEGAKLEHAMLVKVNLHFALLNGVEGTDADFSHSNLKLAELRGATLLSASFRDVEAKGALFGANLGDANLGGAKLAEASFVEAVAPRGLFRRQT